MARAREPVKDRILRTIAKDGGCWLWAGSKTHDGYGVLAIGRRQWRAHRASYEAFVGPITDGYLVCHRCDRPACVNPEHLFLGSDRDNTQDMIAKGRRVAIRGAAHHSSKITPQDRETVRRLRREGHTLAEIGRKFGVSFQTISAICNGVGSYGTG